MGGKRDREEELGVRKVSDVGGDWELQHEQEQREQHELTCDQTGMTLPIVRQLNGLYTGTNITIFLRFKRLLLSRQISVIRFFFFNSLKKAQGRDGLRLGR